MRKRSELRVDMEDWQGGKVYAGYTSFSIDPESFGYQLRLGSYIDGGAGEEEYDTGVVFVPFCIKVFVVYFNVWFRTSKESHRNIITGNPLFWRNLYQSFWL